MWTYGPHRLTSVTEDGECEQCQHLCASVILRAPNSQPRHRPANVLQAGLQKPVIRRCVVYSAHGCDSVCLGRYTSNQLVQHCNLT